LWIDDGAQQRTVDLYSQEAFSLLSREWLRIGWSLKYSYQFAWLGRPIIQLPEDLMRIQDAVYQIAPDVIVETGVAHGGSLVFYASLCHLLGKGRVIGVDISIRPHNRAAIQAHPLSRYISIIEGSSTDPDVINLIREDVGSAESVMVILDSNHSYAHVAGELRAYAPLVTRGSYLVVQDGIMTDLADVPGGRQTWLVDSPAGALRDFLLEHSEFSPEVPSRVFNESAITELVTYWPNGWLKKHT
jgi:cephalosporin hydroxylase